MDLLNLEDKSTLPLNIMDEPVPDSPDEPIPLSTASARPLPSPSIGGVLRPRSDRADPEGTSLNKQDQQQQQQQHRASPGLGAAKSTSTTGAVVAKSAKPTAADSSESPIHFNPDVLDRWIRRNQDSAADNKRSGNKDRVSSPSTHHAIFDPIGAHSSPSPPLVRVVREVPRDASPAVRGTASARESDGKETTSLLLQDQDANEDEEQRLGEESGEELDDDHHHPHHRSAFKNQAADASSDRDDHSESDDLAAPSHTRNRKERRRAEDDAEDLEDDADADLHDQHEHQDTRFDPNQAGRQRRHDPHAAAAAGAAAGSWQQDIQSADGEDADLISRVPDTFMDDFEERLQAAKISKAPAAAMTAISQAATVSGQPQGIARSAISPIGLSFSSSSSFSLSSKLLPQASSINESGETSRENQTKDFAAAANSRHGKDADIKLARPEYKAVQRTTESSDAERQKDGHQPTQRDMRHAQLHPQPKQGGKMEVSSSASAVSVGTEKGTHPQARAQVASTATRNVGSSAPASGGGGGSGGGSVHQNASHRQPEPRSVASRAVTEVRRERQRKQREEEERRAKEQEMKEREDRERNLAERERMHRDRRAALQNAQKQQQHQSYSDSPFTSNHHHYQRQGVYDSVSGMPTSTAASSSSIAAADGGEAHDHRASDGDFGADRHRYLSDFMSEGSRSGLSLAKQGIMTPSDDAHGTPLKSLASLDSDEHQDQDQDGLKLSDSLDKWSTLMKRAVLADFLEAKSDLIQRHHRIVARERAAVEGELIRRAEELDASKDILARLEATLATKEKLIEKLAARFSHKVMFWKWRAKLAARAHEKFVAHIAVLHRMKAISRKVLLAWNSISRGTWKRAVDKQVRLESERRLRAIEEDYHHRLASMEAKLQEAQQEIRAHEEQRQRMEEEMKKAFMRGVCALNMEAMSIFRTADGPEGGSEAQSSEGILTPDLYNNNNNNNNNHNNTGSTMVANPSTASASGFNVANAYVSGQQPHVTNRGNDPRAAGKGPNFSVTGGLGGMVSSQHPSSSAHLEEPHLPRNDAQRGKSVSFVVADDTTAAGVPISRRHPPVPQPHPGYTPNSNSNSSGAAAAIVGGKSVQMRGDRDTLKSHSAHQQQSHQHHQNHNHHSTAGTVRSHSAEEAAPRRTVVTVYGGGHHGK